MISESTAQGLDFFKLQRRLEELEKLNEESLGECKTYEYPERKKGEENED